LKRSTVQLVGSVIIAFVVGVVVGGYLIPSQGPMFGGYQIRPTIGPGPTIRETSTSASIKVNTQSPTSTNTKIFLAADLTLTPPRPTNFPSETFVVVLQAEGPTDHLAGTLFLFNPVSSCRISVEVSGTLFTSSARGNQALNFTGYEPPDPCIQLGEAVVNIRIGLAYAPPDPCILAFHVPGRTITLSGEPTRFIVATASTTTTLRT
jgi:hypothetical protein